ncbi:MAG: polysaccharide deacetylase family protein [Actinomycetia bacterium]|nr:polysaccharide deacetylase family protein [Actinomycetes bacterium]MCP5031437.1 polysaccharide deacetylase family protein [Actinomycetes bacterium]
MTDTDLAEPDDLARAAAQTNQRYWFIDTVDYPDGVRMAVNFTCDFDTMLLRRVLEEPPMQRAQGEFGGRVGIWRLIDLFDSHDVKATIFTPGRICELFPAALQAAHASGHEIADHMWEHQVPDEPDLKRDHVVRSTEALERTVGTRPVGTRSGQEHSLLLEAGYIYDSHGSAHHLPHYRYDPNGQHPLVNLPFHYAIDDAMYFSFAWLASDNSAQRITDPNRVLELWWTAFEEQYELGGYLNICLHPFVSGRALRITMLDELISRMKTMPGVWFPTCEEVARLCLERHPITELDGGR